MDLWLPLATFAFISSITPGPNNAMLSASGMMFGLRRTLPHLCGVWVGFALLLVVCGAGTGVLVMRIPALDTALKMTGSAYLLYLAWTMRMLFEPRTRSASARPLRFGEAMAFQFVNPKAWLMGTTAAAVFTPTIEPRWLAVSGTCAVFAVVNLPCIWGWAMLGTALRQRLASERKRKILGGSVAVLMGYSVAAIWL